LSREFREGLSIELQYTDDLVLNRDGGAASGEDREIEKAYREGNQSKLR